MYKQKIMYAILITLNKYFTHSLNLLLFCGVFCLPWRTETREEHFLILSLIGLDYYSIRINNFNNL